MTDGPVIDNMSLPERGRHNKIEIIKNCYMHIIHIKINFNILHKSTFDYNIIIVSQLSQIPI